MDRREFVKLLASAVFVPSFAALSGGGPVQFPVRTRYRGFDIVIDELPYKPHFRQVYYRRGHWHAAVLYDRDDDLSFIESNTKMAIDRHTKRIKRGC